MEEENAVETVQRYRRDRRVLLDFILSGNLIKKVIMPPGAVSLDDVDLDQVSVDYVLNCARKDNTTNHHKQAGVDSITRSLALEWGTDYDIRVNGIAPGPIGDTAGLSTLGPAEVLRESIKEPMFKLGEKAPPTTHILTYSVSGHNK